MNIRRLENVINACLQEIIFLHTITVKAEIRPLLMKIIPWLRRSLQLYTRFKYSPCNIVLLRKEWSHSSSFFLLMLIFWIYTNWVLTWDMLSKLDLFIYFLKTYFFKNPLELLADVHVTGHGILFSFLGGFCPVGIKGSSKPSFLENGARRMLFNSDNCPKCPTEFEVVPMRFNI